MATHSRIIQPPFRRALDIILVTVMGLLFLHVLLDVPLRLILLIMLCLIGLEILLWIFWIKKIFSISITDDMITGPGPNLCKVSFPRSHLDAEKTENLRPVTKPKGYLDLWPQEGKRIRLFRKILSRGQIFIICKLLLGDAFKASKRRSGYYH